MVSRLHWFAASLRPVELLAPLYGSDQDISQPTGTFTPELSASRSPFSSSGITTVATERFHRWDFHPLEYQLASLHRLFHPLLHAGLARRTEMAISRQLSRCLLECWPKAVLEHSYFAAVTMISTRTPACQSGAPTQTRTGGFCRSTQSFQTAL